jgi:hypothetical protein
MLILCELLLTSLLQAKRKDTGPEYFCSYLGLQHLDLVVGNSNVENGRYTGKHDSFSE